MQPETRYARSRDGHVAYQVYGNGPLDLVFISSWAGDVEVMWEDPSFAPFRCRPRRGSGSRCGPERTVLRALTQRISIYPEVAGYVVAFDCRDGGRAAALVQTARRIIADLAEADTIDVEHLAEALAYRGLNRGVQ